MPFFSEHRQDPVLLPESFCFPFGAAYLLRCDLFRNCQPIKDMLLIFKNICRHNVCINFAYIFYHDRFRPVKHFSFNDLAFSAFALYLLPVLCNYRFYLFHFVIHNKPARLAFRRADIFQLCSLKIVTRAALYECPCPL